jgi:hypothetical protein
MRPLLMHRDRDFDPQQELPRNAQALTRDLGLEVLLGAMSNDDAFLRAVARGALLSAPRADGDTILYRQAILRDCLQNPTVVRQIYDLAVETIEEKKKHYLGAFGTYPSSILYHSMEALQMLMGMLKRLRGIARAHAQRFTSEGFTVLFDLLERELSDEYLACIQGHLSALRFRDGILMSAALGKGNEGTDYVLRRSPGKGHGWLRRFLGVGPPAYTFRIAERDEAGARALSHLKDRGIHLVANALAQSTDHILGFFEALRAELAFYVGCLNLHARLASRGEPTCFPQPEPAGGRRLRFSGLYDVSLALSMDRRLVGNAVDCDGKSLVVITGANQGGKSSFLRGLGLAQLMMQCGMFVGAESFAAELCPALYTHFKREEDATMKSGKLDEELARMSEIVDDLAPNSLVLFNESFSATNEREGSEIARQIVRALLEGGVKVFFVTHLYDFAQDFFNRKLEAALFLRAERQADGTRTFRLVEGEPLETSHGGDLYREVFASARSEETSAFSLQGVP